MGGLNLSALVTGLATGLLITGILDFTENGWLAVGIGAAFIALNCTIMFAAGRFDNDD